MEALLVSANEAAKALSVCPRTLWTLTNDGELRPTRVRGRVLYAVDDLKAFIAAHRETKEKE